MLLKSSLFIKDDLRNSNHDSMNPNHSGTLTLALTTKLTELNENFGKHQAITNFKKHVFPAGNIFNALMETANSNLPLKEKIELYNSIKGRAVYFATYDTTEHYSLRIITQKVEAYEKSATRYGVLALLSAAVAALGVALAKCADCIKPDELISPKAFDFSHFFDGHSAVAQWCHGPAGITALAVIFAVGLFAGYQAWTDTQTSSTFENLKGHVGHLDVSLAN